MTVVESALILAWLAIMLLAFAMAGLVRQLHSLVHPPGNLQPQQSVSPGEALPSAAQQRLGLRTGILLFVGRNCTLCTQLANDPHVLALAERLGLVVVTRTKAEDWKTRQIPTIEDASDVFDALGIRLTPFAIAVQDSRVLGMSRVPTARELEIFSTTVVREEGSSWSASHDHR